MVYTTVSSKTIINRIYRDFKPESQHWVSDAYDWLADVMEACSISPILQKGLTYTVTTKSHKAPLPCGLRYIDAVEYEGYKLDYGGDITIFSLTTEARTTNFSPFGTSKPGEIFQAKTGTLDPLGGNIEPTSTQTSTRYNRGHYYQINPDYIVTSFEEGKIKMHYSAFPMDDEGWVMLPNIYDFKEAAQWYIISKMMLGGWTHPDPAINYLFADDKWFQHSTIAKNKAKFPSVDQMETFRRWWTRAIPEINYSSQFFMNSELSERIALNN